MARRYTSTINVRCLKQHTCVGCGAEYSYLFARKIVGTARKPQAAEAAAQANVQKRVTVEVDSHPCPACGLYQPDMIGARRAKWQKVLFWVSAGVVALLLILSGTHAIQDDVFLPSAACVLGLIGLTQIVVDLRRPNRDLEANRQLAQNSIASGVLRLDKPGQAQPGFEEIGRPSSPALLMAFLLFVLAMLSITVPTITRESEGWPLNRTCYPPVVGPGDSTCYYLTESLQSVKGYFRGTPHAKARLAGGGPEFTLTAHSNTSTWGNQIQVKSEERDSNTRLWMTLELPDKPELAGKEVQCHLMLQTTYPKINQGADTFHVESRNFQDDLSLQLGPPHSGHAYQMIWWWAFVAGMGCFLLSGFLRFSAARRLRNQALPTKVYPLEAPAK